MRQDGKVVEWMDEPTVGYTMYIVQTVQQTTPTSALGKTVDDWPK